MGVPPTRTEQKLKLLCNKCAVCEHKDCSGCTIKRQVKEFVYSCADNLSYTWTNPLIPREMHKFVCLYRGKLKKHRKNIYKNVKTYMPTHKEEPASNVRYNMTHPFNGGRMNPR